MILPKIWIEDSFGKIILILSVCFLYLVLAAPVRDPVGNLWCSISLDFCAGLRRVDKLSEPTTFGLKVYVFVLFQVYCPLSIGGIGFSVLPFRSFHRSIHFGPVPFRSFYRSGCFRPIPFRPIYIKKDRNARIRTVLCRSCTG